MKLEKKKIIKGTITALTGIHIGTGKDTLEVGGVDNAVIKNPRTGEPYIPGSTLKGKMRSLLERVKGKMNLKIKKGNDEYKIRAEELKEKLKDGSTTFQAEHCNCGKCEICEVFGIGVNDQKPDNPIPIRLIVRDAYLTEESKKELEITTDGLLTEVKPEVSLDRITSRSNPRQIERIPEGSKFNFELVLNVYSGDNEENYINLIKEALELVEDDYIGGSGTRGSGQVKFEYDIEEKSLTS